MLPIMTCRNAMVEIDVHRISQDGKKIVSNITPLLQSRIFNRIIRKYFQINLYSSSEMGLIETFCAQFVT